MTADGCSIGFLFDVRNPRQWERPWPTVVGEALDLVVEAESLGADSVWATEHHGFADGYLSQPLTFLTAAAARTSRVRLGTGVLLASMRHPRHISEQAALLDNISGGRLEIGVGAGYSPTEFETFGQDLGRRMALADQRVRELQDDLWQPTLNPPPVQARIPLWLGYQGPQGARRAGRLGVGLLSPNPALVGPYHEGLHEGGHDLAVAAMGGHVNIVLARDPERTARTLAPHYAHQAHSYAEARNGAGVAALDETEVAAQLVDPRSKGLRVLTPQAAVAELQLVIESAPIRHLYFWATVAAMPAELVREHLELVLDEVAPALRSHG